MGRDGFIYINYCLMIGQYLNTFCTGRFIDQRFATVFMPHSHPSVPGSTMSDTESRDQRSTPPSEPRPPARQEAYDSPVSAREQARLADLQRCIESMKKVAGVLEARVTDLECSVGRIGSAFGQMAGLHDIVVGGSSRGRGGGYQTDRGGGGGRRDFYNRHDPPHNHRESEHAPPPFGGGGGFGGRGRARRA